MTKNPRAWKLGMGLVLLLLVVALSAWYCLKNPVTQGGYRGNAMAQLTRAIPQDMSELGALVVANYTEYRANAVRWSAAYFGCLFGAAVLSACAGVLLKMELLKSHPGLKNDLAAVMAALASLLITLLTIGSFEEKWRSNRMAASSMENLAYDLLKTGAAAEKDDFLSRIQKINEARNVGIVGAPSSEETQPEGEKRTKTVKEENDRVEPMN